MPSGQTTLRWDATLVDCGCPAALIRSRRAQQGADEFAVQDLEVTRIPERFRLIDVKIPVDGGERRAEGSGETLHLLGERCHASRLLLPRLVVKARSWR